MLETSDVVEPVFPAATVVLVRDGAEGLEALLVQADFVSIHLPRTPETEGLMLAPVFPKGLTRVKAYPPCAWQALPDGKGRMR